MFKVKFLGDDFRNAERGFDDKDAAIAFAEQQWPWASVWEYRPSANGDWFNIYAFNKV